MGTKANPGDYDCYEKARPDEPMFVLLARDPIAPFLVSIWSSIRMGDPEAATAKFKAMMDRTSIGYTSNPDVNKAGEALDCSQAMFKYRSEHNEFQ